MTLVIVSHDLQPGFQVSWHDEPEDKEPPELEPVGLLVTSDTAITTPDTGKTLLSGFRKSYEIPIKVWEPYFVGKYFQGYRTVFRQTSCFIAFAGSTLTAQHVLNSITEHLSKLRITYISEGLLSPGTYCVIRHCQKNQLEERAGADEWAEDMFLKKDLEGLVTAEVIAENILYSINESLRSARKYKLDAPSLKQMQTDFAAGIYCPVTGQHKLYTFRMEKELNAAGVYEVFAKQDEVPWDKVAVLGMRSEFEADAQAVLDDCIKNREPADAALYAFLNQAIDKVQDSGSNAIDRPSVMKGFKEGRLEKIYHSNEP